MLSLRAGRTPIIAVARLLRRCGQSLYTVSAAGAVGAAGAAGAVFSDTA